MSWTMIVGILLLLYAGYALYRGRVGAGEDDSAAFIQRSERPVQFWFSVIFILVLAALLILNVFHF
jgi:hypothetical protein